MWQKRKEKKNKPWNVFSEDSEIHDLCLLYLLFEKSQSLKPKMKRNRTYILHIRCYLQSLILICLFLVIFSVSRPERKTFRKPSVEHRPRSWPCTVQNGRHCDWYKGESSLCNRSACSIMLEKRPLEVISWTLFQADQTYSLNLAHLMLFHVPI